MMDYSKLHNFIEQDNVNSIKYFLKMFCENNVNTILKTDGETLLLKASSLGALSIIEYLLSVGANINQSNHEGYSALMLANNTKVIDILLNNGANINQYRHEKNKMNALSVNLCSKDTSIVIAKYLIDLGIDTSYTKTLFGFNIIEETKEKNIIEYLKNKEEKVILETSIKKIENKNKKIKV
jgi:ankyrin repeat protein